MMIRERIEEAVHDQFDHIIDELERIKEHTETGDYSMEEIGEELDNLIKEL